MFNVYPFFLPISEGFTVILLLLLFQVLSYCQHLIQKKARSARFSIQMRERILSVTQHASLGAESEFWRTCFTEVRNWEFVSKTLRAERLPLTSSERLMDGAFSIY